MFGGVNSNYGTVATTYGQQSTDSYYLTTSATGTQTIAGNLRVKGDLIVDYTTSTANGFYTSGTSNLGDINAGDISANSVIGALVSSTPGANDNTIALVGGTVGFLNAAEVRYDLDIADVCGSTMYLRAYGDTTTNAMIIDLSGNIEMEGDLTVDGQLTAPNVVYSVQQGTNITVTGTAQNPVVNAITNLNPNVVLDLFNSVPIAVTTPPGGAATLLTQWGGLIPGTVYYISVAGFLSCSVDAVPIMSMYIAVPPIGELMTIAQFPCSATEYGFNTTIAIVVPDTGNPTTTLNILVGGGGGLGAATITGSIANCVIVQTN